MEQRSPNQITVLYSNMCKKPNTVLSDFISAMGGEKILGLRLTLPIDDSEASRTSISFL